MTNKIDKYAQKVRYKLFSEAAEIKDFLVEVLGSKEILKIAPINEIGCTSPGPLFYFGDKKFLDKLISEKVNLCSFGYNDKDRKKGILREVHITAIPKNSDEYQVTFEDGGGNSITNNSDLKINKFAVKLNSNYMIEAGFFYDSNFKKLIARTGDEAIKITRDSLEKCLQEYFIKPCLNCPNYYYNP